jgi:hypothetical protein
MILEESFDFKKTLLVNKDFTEVNSHIDISGILSSEEKIEKSINGFFTFLGYSGFDSTEIFTITSHILDKVENHPDNDDFSMNAAIEEEVNKEDALDTFIASVRESKDRNFLKEVFRSWVQTHMKLATT